jgi:hypothetical protein
LWRKKTGEDGIKEVGWWDANWWCQSSDDVGASARVSRRLSRVPQAVGLVIVLCTTSPEVVLAVSSIARTRADTAQYSLMLSGDDDRDESQNQRRIWRCRGIFYFWSVISKGTHNVMQTCDTVKPRTQVRQLDTDM